MARQVVGRDGRGGPKRTVPRRCPGAVGGVAGRVRRGSAVILSLVCLSGCGAAGAGPADRGFDLHRVRVGHPTAAVAILDDGGAAGPRLAAVGGGVVTVVQHVGGGDFEVREVVAAGDHPVDLAVGDLDGDGALDLVVANHETTYLTLLFGADSGLDEGRSARLPLEVSPHPHAVAVADLDEDGRLDILVDDRDGERLRFHRGVGDGTFEPSHAIPVGGDPYRGMSVADLDGDGHLDVVTPNPRSVAVRLGDGAGSFSAAPDLESSSMPPFSTVVADFDGDGSPDVAAGSGEGPGYVTVWLGRGDGSFAAAPDAPYAIARGPTKLASGDVDGDGIDDILATSYLGDEVTVLLGGREGFRATRLAVDDNPWGVVAGDLTGDGVVDLAVANDGGDHLTIFRGRASSAGPEPTEPTP